MSKYDMHSLDWIEKHLVLFFVAFFVLLFLRLFFLFAQHYIRIDDLYDNGYYWACELTPADFSLKLNGYYKGMLLCWMCCPTMPITSFILYAEHELVAKRTNGVWILFTTKSIFTYRFENSKHVSKKQYVIYWKSY